MGNPSILDISIDSFRNAFGRPKGRPSNSRLSTKTVEDNNLKERLSSLNSPISTLPSTILFDRSFKSKRRKF